MVPEARHFLEGAIDLLGVVEPLLPSTFTSLREAQPGFATGHQGSGEGASRTENLALANPSTITADWQALQALPQSLARHGASLVGLTLPKSLDQLASIPAVAVAQVSTASRLFQSTREATKWQGARAIELSRHLYGVCTMHTRLPEDRPPDPQDLGCISCQRLKRTDEPIYRSGLCRRCYGLVVRARDFGVIWMVPPVELVDLSHRSSRISDRELQRRINLEKRTHPPIEVEERQSRRRRAPMVFQRIDGSATHVLTVESVSVDGVETEKLARCACGQWEARAPIDGADEIIAARFAQHVPSPPVTANACIGHSSVMD